MNMKKLLSLLLSGVLALSLCTPALAASTSDTDARLTQVTQTVKTTLALDTSDYDQFHGNLTEDALSPQWNLNWSNTDGDSLTITADLDGTVLWLYRSDNEPSSSTPSLPEVSREEAQAAAQAFLDKVLDADVESVRLDEDGYSAPSYSDRYDFSGAILLNGIPSPLSCSVSVDMDSGEVVRFNRDALNGLYIGGIPSATAAITADDAGAKLKDLFSLRLEYVLDADSKEAVLRYLPNPLDEYYVDAQTGEVVNLTELRQSFYEKDANGSVTGDAEAPEAAPDGGLTEAEQEGAALLAGALDKETLDKQARAVDGLGLDAYTFASARYTVDPNWKEGDAGVQVSASLTYTREKDGNLWRRYVTLDAKTGELLSVNSSLPWNEDVKRTVTKEKAQKLAEAFLTSFCPDDFARTARYEQPTASPLHDEEKIPSAYDFRYARQENGYFFADDGISVSVDTTDGSISSFSRHFQEDVTFDSPEGIVSEESALTAYQATFVPALGYIQVPVSLSKADDALRELLWQSGYTYCYQLTLGYGLEQEGEYVRGIDAKTGKPVYYQPNQSETITYDDLTGHWVASAAQTLADYGVGWMGGSLKPDSAISQKDMVALLSSMLYRNPVDPDALTEEEVDRLYETAYGQGWLKPEQRKDDASLTRMEIIRMLLNGGGYGGVAALEGIYRCDFTDAASISSADLGYAALAQGLKLVQGDSAGRLNPAKASTRAEALTMVYNFMR